MLKRLPVFICLMIAACTCGKKDFGEDLKLRIPPIPNGEFNAYRVMAGEDSIGYYTKLVAHDWVREAPAYALVNVMHTSTGDIATRDSSLVHVSRARLTPLSAFRFIKTGTNLLTTAVNYAEQSAAVSAYSSAGGEKQQLLPMKKNTFDNDQLSFLGRALQLDPKQAILVNVVNPMGPPLGGDVITAGFRMGGDEMVTVPAGVFDCRKVIVKVEQSEVGLWYEKAGTGRLIKYSAAGTDLAMELLPPAPEETSMDRPVQP